jgi:hypothetical protein
LGIKPQHSFWSHIGSICHLVWNIRKGIDFLIESKKGQIDEKIAMLYGYAMNVNLWRTQNVNANYMIEKIL